MSYSKHFHSFNGAQSSQSSSDEEITSKDNERIQNLWKDLRQNRKQATNSKPMRTQETPSSRASGEYIYQNKDKVSYIERQLTTAQDEATLLKKKLKDAEAEIERCHTKIAKQLNLNAVQLNQLEEMTAKYENLSVIHKEHVERSKEASQALVRQLGEKEKENERLKSQLKEKIDKLANVAYGYEQVTNKASKLETTVGEKSGEINFLKNRIEETERLVEELQESRETENAAMMEVEHLRAEVQRLIRMLKTTKEFKEFADFVGDNDGTKRFLKEAVKHKRTSSSDYTRTNSTSKTLGVQRLSVAGAYADEKDLWVPEEAYKVVLEFIKKQKGILDNENMDMLLFELNRIWSRREAQKIERLLSQHKQEVSKMKRKLSSNMSFDEVQANQLVPRMSVDTQKENQRLSANLSQRIPPSVRIVGGTMKSTNRLDKGVEETTMDSRTMKSQSRLSTGTRRRGDSFEVENDVVGELERLKAKLEEVMEEFIAKRREILSVYGGNPDISIVIRKEDWLLESIESIIGQFSKGQSAIKGRRSERTNNSMVLNYSMI